MIGQGLRSNPQGLALTDHPGPAGAFEQKPTVLSWKSFSGCETLSSSCLGVIE